MPNIFSVVKPVQTVLVSSRAKVALVGKEVLKDDIITLDWHMPCSMEPLLYAISVGKSRFSAKLIAKSKVFVVNFISKKQEKEAWLCGSKSGSNTDKFKECNFTKLQSKYIECPKIAEAAAWLECQVVNEVEAGDHVIFIAKVLHADKKEIDETRLFHITGNKFTTTIE